jgi:hypothetical protein
MYIGYRTAPADFGSMLVTHPIGGFFTHGPGPMGHVPFVILPSLLISYLGNSTLFMLKQRYWFGNIAWRYWKDLFSFLLIYNTRFYFKLYIDLDVAPLEMQRRLEDSHGPYTGKSMA